MNEGDLVEEFSLVDQTGRTVTLSGLLDSGPLVIFFYPKALSPG